MKSSLVVMVLIISYCSSLKLPPNFQKCNREEKNFRNCVLKAAQDGLTQLKEFNIMPSLNPLDVAKLNIRTSSKITTYDQINCKIFGFEGTKLTQFEFDFQKKILIVEGSFPHIRKLCDYVLVGKILVLPINATVVSEVNISNMSLSMTARFEEIKEGEKTFLKFGPTELSLEPDFMTLHIENIFKNEEFADRINNEFNQNWGKVFNNFREEYEENFGAIVENLLNRFFSNVSLEEVFK